MPTCFLLPAPGTWYQASGKNYLNFVFQRFKMGCPLHPFFTYLMAAIYFKPLPARRSIHGTFWPPVQKGSLRSVSLMNPANSLVNCCTYTLWNNFRWWGCALQFQAGNVTGFPLNFGGLSKEHSEEMWDLLWTDTGFGSFKMSRTIYVQMYVYVLCTL